MRIEEADGSVFYSGDCIDIASTFKDNSIDLIITDPPYGINGDRLHQHYNRKESFVVDGYIEIPASQYGEFSTKWIEQAARVLKPGGTIYIVSGYTNLYHILHALKQTDLQEVNHIIWKYNFGVYTKKKYVSSHYHILYYKKPGAIHTFNMECRYGADERTSDGGSLNYLDREDVWIINREYKPGQKKNKNELPTELLAKMILYSSDPGDIVADFFLGGGSTARVAKGLGRRALGIELSEPTFKHAMQQIGKTENNHLIKTIRVPEKSSANRQGERWTPEEQGRLRMRYHDLRRQGKSKGHCILVLKEEFGRGKFSIMNALEKIGDYLPPVET